ncbi:MAG: M23 family metallopeptidase [Pseudomonadota bacterium]
MIKETFGLGTFFCLSTALAAEEFRLGWPVECELGNDCVIQQYVDRDPGSGVQDFGCGTLSYDGHNGTDIRVPTISDMEKGMAVVAARSGTVRGVRDGMPDIDVSSAEAIDVSGRECGNGVVLVHEDGWETQYCHLRESSVEVRSGDRVEQGQRLGEIGMSGSAAFPHLHLSVRRNGAVIDPFAPEMTDACETQSQDQLWISPVPYVSAGFLDAGFAAEVPSYQALKDGMPALSELAAEVPALVVWALYYGPRAGDTLSITITGPEGYRFDYDHLVERDQAQAMRAAGQRRPPNGWPAGSYTATLTYGRGADTQWRVERQIVLSR